MIFLIEYNPPKAQIITLRKYEDADRRKAQDERLEIELELNRKGIAHEVVLLEAVSEAALRRTHGRYFMSSTEIMESMIDAIEKQSTELLAK